jgi:hypothetical protein
MKMELESEYCVPKKKVSRFVREAEENEKRQALLREIDEKAESAREFLRKCRRVYSANAALCRAEGRLQERLAEFERENDTF